MRRSTIMIISILAMLLLAGNLMGFTATIHTHTNYLGAAYIEIRDGIGELIQRIPWQPESTFVINVNSNNTKVSGYLNPDHIGYVATVFASREVNGITITDTDSHNFHYGIANFHLYVDLSGNGSIPDDPPMQD